MKNKLSAKYRRLGTSHRVSLRANESGMVSILVTMILMIVISLLVLGFAEISSRNQRQALDQQLSTQAFYAAESGINDARNLINQTLQTGGQLYAKPDCSDGTGAAQHLWSQIDSLATIDAGHSVSYSCLMVNPTPASLSYTATSKSVVVPVAAANGAGINSITFNWQATGNSATPLASCPTGLTNAFSPATSLGWNCGYGVLRFDLVPTAGAQTAASLQANTMTTFLMPLNGSASGTFGYAPLSNNLVAAKCSNTNCTATVSGLNAAQYYLRVTSIYQNSALQISAKDAAGNQLGLTGAQVVIDATGKAQDVLRRIQVHAPLGNAGTSQLPDYAIESSDSLCKRFAVMPGGYFQNEATVGGANPANTLCQ